MRREEGLADVISMHSLVVALGVTKNSAATYRLRISVHMWARCIGKWRWSARAVCGLGSQAIQRTPLQALGSKWQSNWPVLTAHLHCWRRLLFSVLSAWPVEATYRRQRQFKAGRERFEQLLQQFKAESDSNSFYGNSKQRADSNSLYKNWRRFPVILAVLFCPSLARL